MRSEQLGETLLPKRLALPVFASDALSSNAYATQEILMVLALGGVAFLNFTPWIAFGVVLVYFVVIASYRQNVHAYPSGGGDYEVVSTNLGQKPGVFVASALLIDYVLTVAVSIAAAVANIVSAAPWFATHKVELAIFLIALITAMNLRGVKESGLAFAIPSYAFMFSVIGMIIYAIIRIGNGAELKAESADWEIANEGAITGAALVFLLARAFSSGTTALTGIEAISNGVPSFQKPKSKNAATTLLLMGIIAMSMFSGLTWLALKTGVKVAEHSGDLIGLPDGQPQKTVIAQVAAAVFSNFTPGFYLITATTAMILVLAANTAFNGFPVLGSILARDGFLPRQLHNRGDRLAFSNGIFVLALAAMLLVIIYKAEVTALIQLYILGVFTSFTLSQLGMIKHWTRLLKSESRPETRRKMFISRVINSVGLFFTGTVLIVVLITKFTHGAWIVTIAMPLLYLLMRRIRNHYDDSEVELSLPVDAKSTLPSNVYAVVMVSKVHKATMRAINYARASRPSVLEVVTVNIDQNKTDALIREWEERKMPVPLKVLDSPYREITRPLVQYVEGLQAGTNDLVVVYLPEVVVGSWWAGVLHNHSALRLKTRLRLSRRVIIASVPFQMSSSEGLSEKFDRASPTTVRRTDY
jgi:amino acid transporter